MKKLAKRSISGVYYFICDVCRSEFSADESDYLVSSGYWNEIEHYGFLGMKTRILRTPIWILKSECPVCGSNVPFEFPTGEPVKKVDDYYDGL